MCLHNLIFYNGFLTTSSKIPATLTVSSFGLIPNTLHHTPLLERETEAREDDQSDRGRAGPHPSKGCGILGPGWAMQCPSFFHPTPV